MTFVNTLENVLVTAFVGFVFWFAYLTVQTIASLSIRLRETDMLVAELCTGLIQAELVREESVPTHTHRQSETAAA